MRQVVRHGSVGLSVRHSGAREAGRPHALLLHALFGSGDDWAPLESAWPGSFSVLDFSGHGASDWLPGRGYSPELFAADADVVLADLAVEGPVHLAGAGVGAYAALLVAGARRDDVAGVLLQPGEGFTGGGAHPGELAPQDERAWLARVGAPDREPGQPGPDPLVASCRRDVRPADYAGEFAAAAPTLLLPEVDPAPAWLAAARDRGRASTAPADPRAALEALAALSARSL